MRACEFPPAPAPAIAFDVLLKLSPGSQLSAEPFITDLVADWNSGHITVLADPTDKRCERLAATNFVSLRPSYFAALTSSIDMAARSGRHLVALLGDATVDPAAVARLSSVFSHDPMIGYAIPRIADRDGDHVLPLPSANGYDLWRYDRRILSHVPSLQLVPEFLAGCIVIRNELLANFPVIDQRLASLEGALLQGMIASRRRGYRIAIVNRVVIPHPLSGPAYPEISADEQAVIEARFPDTANAHSMLQNLSCHQREALLARAVSQSRRMLLDCRNLPDMHNGTSYAILGILDGLSALETGWSIDVWVGRPGSEFHRLQERYPNFAIIDGAVTETYSAAIRLTQPWELATVAELHRRALVVVVTMLDTIAWDILLAGAAEFERSWSFIANHADGLCYISQFTRERFRLRFPVAPHVRELVTHLSFDPADYADVNVANEGAQRSHILIIGNSYDHKGLPQTVEILVNAFPFEQFVAIGYEGPEAANLKSIASGQIPSEKMERLYAEARMIVFPSFYEGFGFPILKGLAYGADVVARRSALLDEIASYCASQARIVPFDDMSSLIEAVGRILAGDAVEAIPLGSAASGANNPLGWREVALRLSEFADELAAAPSATTYDQRDAVLRYIGPGGQA